MTGRAASGRRLHGIRPNAGRTAASGLDAGLAHGRLPLPDADITLGNGLRVVVCSAPVIPLVEIRLTVPYAAAGPGEVALCQLLAGILMHGTAHREADSYDAALAAHGATLNATADARKFTVSGHTMADALPAVLALLAETVRSPRLTGDVITPERDRLARRIRLATHQPAALAQHALLRRRYGEEAAARRQPTPELAAACTPDGLAEVHTRHLGARGAVLVLVGDLRPEEAVATVTDVLDSWEAGPDGDVPEVPPWFAGGPLRRVDRPGGVQSVIRLATPALPRPDPGYPALHLAQLVFGGSFASRLVTRLREEEGYAYQLGSGMESVPGASTLMIEADTAAEHTVPALAVIRGELERMAAEPPSVREVDAARSYAVGSTATAMSSPGALASGLANLLHIGVGSDWLHNWGPLLESVPYDAVGEAAHRFFRPADFTGVVVADEASVAPLRRGATDELDF
ncbi:M16 family metallopeptidase [Streptomyces pacificus]|uniref:Insulinase family protein n=1 Tax=Streptomyces pacificus TaxID=2705029 RepID=A0A6A0B360_9ACTN|nr:pitrilysin family protein [Streptomyces pacificus]GFH39526.1 insulinase family protein [Streptomyces pacificus]